jgi:signal transduction histidine kinase
VNLIKNAIEATSEGGKVSITLTEVTMILAEGKKELVNI